MTDKLRSYTNSDNVVVEVSKEHLDASVEIKLQLQENSVGRKCPWNTHKKMMEDNDFSDSDTNESYRCLVKHYQKEVGKLRKVDEYANFVADSKLDAIRKSVGELYYQKIDNQQVLRELNKIKKQVTVSALAVEEIRNLFIDEFEFNIPHYVYQPRLLASKNKGILVITDWHLGLKIDNVKGNSYSLEIAKKRLNKLKQEALDYCKLFGITDLCVCSLGDVIEHVSMRNTNQAFEAEINFAQQVVKGTEYIVDLLVGLAEYVNVEFEGVAGNHDRSNGDLSANIDGDNVVVIINENIKNFIKLSKIDRLTMIENDAYMNEIVKEVNGKRIKLVHGDEEQKDANTIKSHISMDGQIYDCVVKGHKHSFKVIEENDGRMVVQVGCLSGRNNYSKKFKCTTNAGQAILVIREDGKILPIPIDLQIA